MRSKIESQSVALEQQSKLLSASDGYIGNVYIHTQAGRFYANRPTWDVNAIAHALGQTARYRGNTDEFYSVAEHSVLVSLLMQEVTGGDPREGLFHDATESVLPDVSAPFKQLFPDLRRVDNELDRSLRDHFGLPQEKTQACKHADWLALFIESAQILPERGADFEDPYNFRTEALRLREQKGWKIVCLPWREAKGIFLQRLRQLERKR
jgi:uncharacterized protein